MTYPRTFASGGIYLIFGCFSLLVCRQIAATFADAAPEWISPTILGLGFFSLTLLRPGAGLLGYCALVPTISGLEKTSIYTFSAPANFALCAVFLAWILRRSRSIPRLCESVGHYILPLALLSTIAFTSLVLNLQQSRQLFSSSIWIICEFGFEDPRFALMASFLLIGGIAFGLMLSLEFGSGLTLVQYMPAIFRLWFVELVAFAVIQLSAQLPPPSPAFAVNSPFQDIHSFGSFAVMLFAYFMCSAIAATRCAERIIAGATAILSFGLCIASYSRITWIVTAIICISTAIFRARPLYVIAAVAGTVAVLLPIAAFPEPSVVLRNSYSHRLWTAVNIRALYQGESLRRNYFSRALVMMRTHPIAGTGVGSFRRVSNNFAAATAQGADEHEFAHNIFLQIGAELGIPALALFVVLLWQAKPYLEATLRGAAAAGFLAYLATQLTANSLLIFPPQPILFWLLIAALASSIPAAASPI